MSGTTRRAHGSPAFRLLASLSLLSRLALPHLHAVHAGPLASTGAPTAIADAAPAAADHTTRITAAASLAHHRHHDASRCPVCQAIAHGAVLPAAGRAIVRSDDIACARRLASTASAIRPRSSAPSRAPPLLS